jgi:hypothetical protein
MRGCSPLSPGELPAVPEKRKGRGQIMNSPPSKGELLVILPATSAPVLPTWRKDALHRDTEIERQVRHHVVVRLIATCWGDGLV